MTKDDFLSAATTAALASSAASGFPAGITVAQAALESAWGNSKLAQLAQNYFGIKRRRGRTTIELPTHECVNGARVLITSRFAKYDSMQDCFRDRDRMIATLAVYQEARDAAADAESFIRVLARHWATDPAYAEKVLYIYRAHNLDAISRQ